MTAIFNYETEVGLDESGVQKFLDFAVDSLRKRNIDFDSGNEIVLAVVSASRSQELNSQFRGKDKPTDVLSFQSEDPDCLGDLILCAEVIESQAKENGWSPLHEYCYMILHGMLHLLGYEHETDDKAAEEMYGLQDSIFFEFFPGEK